MVESMVRKYVYKSHGKFKLAMIHIDDNAKITGRTIPVRKLANKFIPFIGYSCSRPISNVQIEYNIGNLWSAQ